MRKYVFLLLLITNTVLVAQEKEFYNHEGFAVNDLYGIMEYGYGYEIVSPKYKYINHHIKDNIVLFNSADSVHFYNKQGGNDIVLKLISSNVSHLNVDFSIYSNENESFLVSNSYSNRLKLPHKYNRVLVNSKRLLGFTEQAIYVASVDTPTDILLKLDNITNYHYYFANGDFLKGQSELIHIFYNESKIQVYNNNFKFLKEYVGHKFSYERMLENVSLDFPQAETKYMHPSLQIVKEWFYEKKNDKTLITKRSDGIEQHLIISGDYILFQEDDNLDWISILNLETKQRYKFRVDFKNKIVLLPKKYLKELNPEFL